MKNNAATTMSRLNQTPGRVFFFAEHRVPIGAFCSICQSKRLPRRRNLDDLIAWEKNCDHCLGTVLEPIPLTEFFDEEV